jgi:hypothetical protein
MPGLSAKVQPVKMRFAEPSKRSSSTSINALVSGFSVGGRV